MGVCRLLVVISDMRGEREYMAAALRRLASIPYIGKSRIVGPSFSLAVAPDGTEKHCDARAIAG